MSKDKTKLKVSAIQKGTVIDRIPAEKLFSVIKILGLDKISEPITFGTNLDSRFLGKKAIIKISNRFFKEQEINKIALIAPSAKINIIDEYQVVEKKEVQIPDEIIGIAKCVNPKCITNHENMTTRFKVIDKENIALKCHYCEKITDQEHLKIFRS